MTFKAFLGNRYAHWLSQILFDLAVVAVRDVAHMKYSLATISSSLRFIIGRKAIQIIGLFSLSQSGKILYRVDSTHTQNVSFSRLEFNISTSEIFNRISVTLRFAITLERVHINFTQPTVFVVASCYEMLLRCTCR